MKDGINVSLIKKRKREGKFLGMTQEINRNLFANEKNSSMKGKIICCFSNFFLEEVAVNYFFLLYFFKQFLN